MTYTIKSASFADPDHQTAVADTDEVGLVAASELDTPDLWAAILDWGTPAAFVAPAVAPVAISDRQFAQQLAIAGVITEAEALAWAARGELPAALETAIGELPGADRFGARMLLSSATTYEFDHPLAGQLGELLGFDEPARRALWTAAAAL